MIDERLIDLEDVDRELLPVSKAPSTGAEVIDGNSHTELLQRSQLAQEPALDPSASRPSVISSTSACGGSSLRLSISPTSPGNPTHASCLIETLTLTYSGVGARRTRCHARSCAHACSRTQCPSVTIRPVSSASPMNRSGPIRPRVGCCQRSSASTPTVLPSWRDTIGWYSRRTRCGRALGVARFVARTARAPSGAWSPGTTAPRSCPRPSRRTSRIGHCATARPPVHPTIAAGDPDRCRDVHGTPVENEALAECRQDPCGDPLRLSLAADTFEQDRELVASQSRRRVARTDQWLDLRGDVP